MKTTIVAFSALAVLTACSSGDGSDTADPGPDGDRPDTFEMGPTRVESYAGIEVTVPAAWGHSVAPTGGGEDDLLDCGSGLPDEASVGRPGFTSDACLTIDPDDLQPVAPFVWLGVELEDGEQASGDYTIETRSVAGVPVTVASTDDAERAAILGSVTEVDEVDEVDSNGCSLDPAPPGGLSEEGLGAVHGMAVCIYDDDTLVASWRRGAARAKEFTAAVYARDVAMSRCTTSSDTTVEIVVDADDDFGKPGAQQHPRFVVNPMCGTVAEPNGTNVVLTPAAVRTWHHELVRQHVMGAYDGPLSEFFLMPMG